MSAWLHYLPHLIGLYAGKRLCDYLIRKTEKIAADSLAGLIRLGWRRLLKGNKMAPTETATQQLGSFGSVTESYAAGVGSVSGAASLPATAFGLSLQVSVKGSLDAKQLIDYLAQKIGGPVPAEVAKFLEAALAAS